MCVDRRGRDPCQYNRSQDKRSSSLVSSPYPATSAGPRASVGIEYPRAQTGYVRAYLIAFHFQERNGFVVMVRNQIFPSAKTSIKNGGTCTLYSHCTSAQPVTATLNRIVRDESHGLDSILQRSLLA